MARKPKAQQELDALAAEIVKERERAKVLYKSSGKKLDRLVAQCDVDQEFDLPDGRTAVVVDKFADGKLTAFKTVGFSLYDLEVVDAPEW